MKTVKFLMSLLVVGMLVSPLAAEEEQSKCDVEYDKCTEKCGENEKCFDKCDKAYEKCTSKEEEK